MGFTEIPKEAANRKYSVVFVQAAFCHVHNELPAIMEHVKTVMAPGGLLLINDDMEKSARQVGFKSADGIDLATNYNNTAKAIRAGEIGMNLALCTLGSIKASKL